MRLRTSWNPVQKLSWNSLMLRQGQEIWLTQFFVSEWVVIIYWRTDLKALRKIHESWRKRCTQALTQPHPNVLEQMASSYKRMWSVCWQSTLIYFLKTTNIDKVFNSFALQTPVSFQSQARVCYWGRRQGHCFCCRLICHKNSKASNVHTERKSEELTGLIHFIDRLLTAFSMPSPFP